MDNILDLCGKWQLRWADGCRGGLNYHHEKTTDESKWIEATVPGEVHLDLMDAGIIGDPCISINCLSARWEEECFWSYRRTFEVPEMALKNRLWLNFEGLDYNARIFLNCMEVGRHANFFTLAEWKSPES